MIKNYLPGQTEGLWAFKVDRGSHLFFAELIFALERSLGGVVGLGHYESGLKSKRQKSYKKIF